MKMLRSETTATTTFLVAVYATVIVPLLANKETTCMGGTFFAGQLATVTCSFPVDIKADRLSVSVFQYPLNSTSSDQRKDVLSCGWEENEEQPRCTVTEGFAYNYFTGEKLQVTIINASQQFSGSYVCQTVPPTGSCTHMCNLIIEDYMSCPMTTLNCSEKCFNASAEETCKVTSWAPYCISYCIPACIVAVIATYLCAVERFYIVSTIRRIRSGKMNSGSGSSEACDDGECPAGNDPIDMTNPFESPWGNTDGNNDLDKFSNSVFNSQSSGINSCEDAAQPLNRQVITTPQKQLEKRKKPVLSCL